MRRAVVVFAVLVSAACSNAPKPVTTEEKPAAKKELKAPDEFYVKFETSKGDFIIETVREWAPRGTDRFYELIQSKFFDGARFFRVRPKFVVQFGISKDPAKSELWRQLRLADDPVKEKNRRGYVSYAKAGPGSRTTQIFINLADNSERLDNDGFAPFGRVMEGMEVVDRLYAGYGEMQPRGGGPDPQKIETMGEDYLARSYPLLDRIKRAAVVPAPVKKP